MTDPLEAAREQWAAEAMAAALDPLRLVAAEMRGAFGDPAEARFAEALRLALAELLTSIARPGSDEMAAADKALAELRPTTTEEDHDA